MASNVDSVQGTNDDATVSKLSSVNLGYYHDPYLNYFVVPSSRTRRAPLINRGYWSRVAAITKVINEFLEGGPKQEKQIISLGAGYDTQFFRLKAAKKQPHKYFELDFPSTMMKKAKIIHKHEALFSLVEPSPDSGEQDEKKESISMKMRKSPVFNTTDYCLIGCDMRDKENTTQLLAENGVDFNKPTLFLSECVLVYVQPEEGSQILHWAANQFTGGVCVVTYEQIHPFDCFGRTMMKNLQSRGCSLLSLETFPDLNAHKKRFLGLGWDRWSGWDMNNVYNHFMDKEETKRIEKLELFDEFEEWHMIQGHYCINMASTDPKNVSNSQTEIKEKSWLASIGILGKDTPAPVKPPKNDLKYMM